MKVAVRCGALRSTLFRGNGTCKGDPNMHLISISLRSVLHLGVGHTLAAECECYAVCAVVMVRSFHNFLSQLHNT